MSVPAHELKRGDRGPDVARLYEHLRGLGYAVHAPTDRAVYDKALEAAVRRYQEFFALPGEGALTQATLAHMREPRCGVLDLLPRTAGTVDYSVIGWPKTDLNYAMLRYTPDLPASAVDDAIRQAVDTWAAVTPLTITRRELPQPLALLLRNAILSNSGAFLGLMRTIASLPGIDILVGFFKGSHGDAHPFPSNTTVIGHGFFPPPVADAFPGDVHLNDVNKFIVDLSQNGPDLVSTLLHEFGHALGLAHAPASVAESVMKPLAQRKRDLSPTDIEQVQSLYGAG